MSACPIIGVDPGLSGALARFDPEIRSLEVFDVPVHKLGSKTVVDHYGLARIIDGCGRTAPSAGETAHSR